MKGVMAWCGSWLPNKRADRVRWGLAVVLLLAAAVVPPVSPEISTSAQAVPSGYTKVFASLTMSARRSGIIMRMPSRPPRIVLAVML